MTYDDLARRIAEMTPEQRQQPVIIDDGEDGPLDAYIGPASSDYFRMEWDEDEDALVETDEVAVPKGMPIIWGS